MPACELNGIKLHWMERGAGPPMLLLGGTLSLGPEDFAPQIEHFSQTFRVILPDRRGYGRSRPPDRDYPPDFYQRDADDIAALLQELRAEETVVLGWSEGANVSVCLARTYPKLLRRLAVSYTHLDVYKRQAPPFGRDTDAVLSELAGYSIEEIINLKVAGAVW